MSTEDSGLFPTEAPVMLPDVFCHTLLYALLQCLTGNSSTTQVRTWYSPDATIHETAK